MLTEINSHRHFQAKRILYVLRFCFISLIILAGCASKWETVVISPDGSEFIVNTEVLESQTTFIDEGHGIPLERVLWMGGHYVIECLVLIESGGIRHEFDWADHAEHAWWQETGQVEIGDETFSPSHIEAEPSVLLGQVQASITDIAPTVSAALGLPAPSQSTGLALDESTAGHVMLLFLDGFGYPRYVEARDAGLIPNLSALSAPLLGLTEYPPSTRVGTAALLTGAGSKINGVDGRRVRNTELETLFDIASNAGLDVVAVEGDALSFNLRGADIQLSGDRDGNGSTDDNVLAHALNVLKSGMPDLFFIHFHGIDDAGHTYGPGTIEEENAIRKVDEGVGEILTAAPADTLVIIFADHGMHLVEEEGRLGNHGHLIERDMLIPIFVTTK